MSPEKVRHFKKNAGLLVAVTGMAIISRLSAGEIQAQELSEPTPVATPTHRTFEPSSRLDISQPTATIASITTSSEAVQPRATAIQDRLVIPITATPRPTPVGEPKFDIALLGMTGSNVVVDKDLNPDKFYYSNPYVLDGPFVGAQFINNGPDDSANVTYGVEFRNINSSEQFTASKILSLRAVPNKVTVNFKELTSTSTGKTLDLARLPVGSYTYTVCADSKHTSNDLDYSNNCGTRTFSVGSADLAIKDPKIDAIQRTSVGYDVTYSYTTINIGTAPTESQTIYSETAIDFNGDNFPEVTIGAQEDHQGVLNPGEWFRLTRQIHVNNTFSGAFRLAVGTNYLFTTNESNKVNNVAIVSGSLAPTITPTATSTATSQTRSAPTAQARN